jgi:hypothetical protein
VCWYFSLLARHLAWNCRSNSFIAPDKLRSLIGLIALKVGLKLGNGSSEISSPNELALPYKVVVGA